MSQAETFTGPTIYTEMEDTGGVGEDPPGWNTRWEEIKFEKPIMWEEKLRQTNNMTRNWIKTRLQRPARSIQMPCPTRNS